MHIANDNSDDFVTNLFKRIKITKNHYYNQRFRRKVLGHMDQYLEDPTASRYKVLQRALADYSAYHNNSEIHPLDEEI